MKKVGLFLMLLVLGSLGFSVTLDQRVVNVATINMNTSTQFTASRSTLNWIVLVQSKAYLNMMSTANAAATDMLLYPGVYNVVRLKANQPNFKIRGSGTENVTIIWQDPAAGVVPVASGYDNGTVRTYVAASTTTTTDVVETQYLVVANDGAASLTVALTGPNGFNQNLTLLPGNVIDEKFQVFTRFVITATTAFRAYTRR